MGQYNLVADPNAINPGQVQGWIDRFNSLPGARDFLNIPGKPGGDLTITTTPIVLTFRPLIDKQSPGELPV